MRQWIKGVVAVTYSMCLWCGQQAHAQEKGEDTLPDTTIIVTDTIELNDEALIGTAQQPNDKADTVIITSEQRERKIPRKAALYAAALPGLGQAYNGSYWKIPIVYGTFITLGWFATFNNDRYRVFRRANIALQNGLIEENPLREAPNGNNARVVGDAVERFRRDRDFTYILVAGAYALQIMEAIVDSHLIEFDINEELSLEVQPMAGQTLAIASQVNFVPGMGVSLLLKIK
jgi:hypothetical protein